MLQGGSALGEATNYLIAAQPSFIRWRFQRMPQLRTAFGAGAWFEQVFVSGRG